MSEQGTGLTRLQWLCPGTQCCPNGHRLRNWNLFRAPSRHLQTGVLLGCRCRIFVEAVCPLAGLSDDQTRKQKLPAKLHESMLKMLWCEVLASFAWCDLTDASTPTIGTA